MFAVAVVGGLWIYSRATGGEITICVQKSGTVRVVGDGFKRSECKKNETLLSWNIQGLPGPKGDKGDSGQEFHLLDANDQDLGIAVSGSGTYVPSLGVFAGFLANSRTRDVQMSVVQLNGGIFFVDNNCTSQAFIMDRADRSPPALMSLIKSTGVSPRYFKFTGTTGAAVGASLLPEAPPSASCATVATSTPNAYMLEEVTLPFTEPIAWPLRVE